MVPINGIISTSMSNLLNNEEIEEKLKDLGVDWSVVGGATLERVYNFDDFSQALSFVNKVGEVAEDLNHHPQIQLEWGKVVIILTTHSANGLTPADFNFAKTI